MNVFNQYLLTQIPELHYGRWDRAGSVPSRIYHPWRVGRFLSSWEGGSIPSHWVPWETVFLHQVGSKASLDHLSCHQVALTWKVLEIEFPHYFDASIDSGVLCISLTCVKTFVAPDAFDVASLVIIIPITVIQIGIDTIMKNPHLSFKFLVTGLALVGKAAIVSCFCAIFMYRCRHCHF